jgi:hypothetical protein
MIKLNIVIKYIGTSANVQYITIVLYIFRVNQCIYIFIIFLKYAFIF